MKAENTNNKKPAYALKVYVYKIIPRDCPFCNKHLESTVIIRPKGKSVNNRLKVCKDCDKNFADIEYYLMYENRLLCINSDLLPELIAERNEKIEARKKLQEENIARKKARQEEINLEKQKIEEIEKQQLEEERIKAQNKKEEIFEKISRTQKLDKHIIEAFKTEWDKVNFNLQELSKLAYVFFVRNNNGALSCIVTTKANPPPKSNVKGIHIISARSKLSTKLHSHFELKQKDEAFEVIEKINLKKSIDQTNSPEGQKANQVANEKEKADSYDEIKTVYVYFRLTNTCVKYKHDIESLTAKTTNAKNGTKIKVNVFHCKACDKYFINYEALQKYISKGVYPSLPYALTNDLSGFLHDASKLMLYGYRVADGTLTTQERRAVLSWIIDSGLLTKAEIIKDLQFKVRYNGSKKGNERAKAKWLDDIQFVSQYVMDNKQTINAAFVVRK